jgi:hypothetical protein
MTDYPILITDYHQGREAECPAPLGRLDHTIDRHHFLFQFQVSGFNSV